MKILLLQLFILLFSAYSCKQDYPVSAKATVEPIVVMQDTIQSIAFEKDVLPILQTKCSPCHFTGGKMYAKMPFDNPQTIQDHPDGVIRRFKEPEWTTIKAYLGK
jgi:hypothetical protein